MKSTCALFLWVWCRYFVLFKDRMGTLPVGLIAFFCPLWRAHAHSSCSSDGVSLFFITTGWALFQMVWWRFSVLYKERMRTPPVGLMAAAISRSGPTRPSLAATASIPRDRRWRSPPPRCRRRGKSASSPRPPAAQHRRLEPWQQVRGRAWLPQIFPKATGTYNLKYSISRWVIYPNNSSKNRKMEAKKGRENLV